MTSIRGIPGAGPIKTTDGRHKNRNRIEIKCEDLRAIELFLPPEDTGDFIQFPLLGVEASLVQKSLVSTNQ